MDVAIELSALSIWLSKKSNRVKTNLLVQAIVSAWATRRPVSRASPVTKLESVGLKAKELAVVGDPARRAWTASRKERLGDASPRTTAEALGELWSPTWWAVVPSLRWRRSRRGSRIQLSLPLRVISQASAIAGTFLGARASADHRGASGVGYVGL